MFFLRGNNYDHFLWKQSVELVTSITSAVTHVMAHVYNITCEF